MVAICWGWQRSKPEKGKENTYGKNRCRWRRQHHLLKNAIERYVRYSGSSSFHLCPHGTHHEETEKNENLC